MRTAGHMAYDCFTQAAGGVKWPSWDDLPQETRQKWEAVADETLEWRYNKWGEEE